MSRSRDPPGSGFLFLDRDKGFLYSSEPLRTRLRASRRGCFFTVFDQEEEVER
jgi:hypothetical protein